MHVLCGIPAIGTPLLSELLSFPIGDRKVDLTREIDDYWKFGVLLLDDATGSHIAAIESEARGNAARINGRVFQSWLAGGGKQPTTWATLVSVLQDTGLGGFAHEIEVTKLYDAGMLQ